MMKSSLSIILILAVVAVYAQSRESMIQLELKNYSTKESLNQVVSEGEMVDGVPNGEWEYYMLYDRNIMYYKGNYINGKKHGTWNNYSLLPPMGYTNNYDLVRSTEIWKNGLLFQFKMGQNNMLVLVKNGLGEPYVSELRRLDEAFENSYRRSHSNTIAPESGESVESIQSRIIPMIRDELIRSKQYAELKFWTLGQKLRLHEVYDSGDIIYQLSQQWDQNILFSTEIYENEILVKKFLYMNGDPNDVIQYNYYENGNMESMKHFINDTIPTGKWIEKYPDGSNKTQGSYVNGLKEGKWKLWDEEGDVKVIKYNKGEPH